MPDYARTFSHIYVEEEAWTFPLTKQILARFPESSIILIRHYKDVFNRRRQDYALQHRVKPLILAVKKDGFFYPGAPVCQDFGNTHFYYSSCVMNCPFDCEYCYLKGMYPSGCMVIFVNLEDYFREAEKILARQSMYICVSYDSDLPAVEPMTGYVKAWSGFAGRRAANGKLVNGQTAGRKAPDRRTADGRAADGEDLLKIEIRTKSAGLCWDSLYPYPNVIYAFTLSPQPVIEAYEHGTPSLASRLDCIRKGLEKGFSIRLCFDPMLFLPGWRQIYTEMMQQVLDTVDIDKVQDISVGSFRISGEYLAPMRRMQPYCSIVWFPYVKKGSYYQYDEEIANEMEGFLLTELSRHIGPEKIFTK